MAYSFPRDLLCELFFPSLGWTDVTDRLFEGTPVSITWGQSAEQGKVAPSYVTGAFKNITGDFSPGNPHGEWFGQLGRNTPMRISLRPYRDTYSRTVVNGWSSADTGEAWTNTGNGSPAASDFQVAGGLGTQSVPATVTYRISKLATVDVPNPQVRVTLKSLGFTDVLGAAVEPANLVLRGTDTPSTDYYMVRVTIPADQSVTIGITKFSTGIFYAGPVTVPGLTYTGQDLTVVLQAEDHWLGGKVYDSTAGGEPYEWQVEVSGFASDWLTGGYVGIRSGVASGNTNTKPVVFSYDNFEVRDVRFSGELAEFKPRWDESHRAKWVEFEAAGLLRRLERGNRPLKTAVERFIVQHATQPVAYWPLDDQTLVTSGRVAAGAGTPAVINRPTPGAPTIEFLPGFAFGTGETAPWLNPVAKIEQGTYTRCAPDAAPTDWTIHASITFTGGPYTDVLNADRFYMGSPAAGSWILYFYSASQQIQVVDYTGATVATVDVDIYDGNPHHVGLRTADAAPFVDWELIIDGGVLDSGSISGTNTSLVRAVFDQSAVGEDLERSIGHVSIYSGAGVNDNDMYEAMRGWIGETAGRRLERICDEEGIPFFSFGDLDDTMPMGPQYPDTLTEIIEECVRTELGLGYEPRGTFGLGLRTSLSLSNQDPTLTLDYSGGQVAPGLLPKLDDKDTVNYVTAKRRDGGEYTAIQETGPLNTQNPWDDPDGVGLNDDQIDVNTETDDLLPSVAGWLKHLGTVDEDRFPSIAMNMRSRGITEAKQIEALSIRPGDRIVVENLSAADIYDPVNQLAFGGTETITGKREHELVFNTVPASPYVTFVLDADRLDSASSSLTSDITAAPASFQVTTTDSMDLWTTSGGSFPFDVIVGGQQMTISAISGASSPQTFTVSDASVNGVSRAWPAGTRVRIANRKYLA